MRLHIKCLAYLVLVAALLLLTACGNDSPQIMITTQNGIITHNSITTYNGIDQQICHVADGGQREYCIEINAKDFQGNYGISDCPETQKGDHHDKTCY